MQGVFRAQGLWVTGRDLGEQRRRSHFLKHVEVVIARGAIRAKRDHHILSEKLANRARAAG